MLPLKKILCPTDFSEPSYEALKAGSELALHFDAELCLVHIVPPVPLIPAAPHIPATFDTSLYQQELEASSKKTLQEVFKQLESDRLHSRLIVVQGDPAYQIVKIAKEERVDLILLATHGRSGWQRIVFGSVAEKVVRLAPCPVLLIRYPHEENEVADTDDIGKPDEGRRDKKKAYQEKIEAQLKEWSAKIDNLKAKGDKAKAEAKTIYRKQIKNLSLKQEATRQKFQELKGSGGEAWEELRVGVDKALEDLKGAFNRAKSKFREK
jgi:nucleotide-binding universal stress UspA family protein